jgi:hypothetical protein
VSEREARSGGRPGLVEPPGPTVDAVLERVKNLVAGHSDTPVISKRMVKNQ